MKTTFQISLRRAATATFLLSCFYMNSQVATFAKRPGENNRLTNQVTGEPNAGARSLFSGLLAFSAVPGQGQIDITWTTATENNNDYFLVERSIDGLNWETVVTVDGAGNSSEAHYYNCVDPSPYAEGISYYRLKETYFTGDYSYSDILAVEIKDQPAEIQLYPNPAVSHIKIMTDSETDNYTVSFYNTAGRLVKQVMDNTRGLLIDVMDLETGKYFAVVDSGKKITRVQFVKN